MKGFTSMSMRTSDAVAISIVICAARSTQKRYGHYDRRGQIRERVSIDERSEVVEARSRIGDWEADTVIGKLGGAVLVTLVERRSR